MVMTPARLLGVLLLCALACKSEPDDEPPEFDGTMVDLVEPMLWQPQAAADDPFSDHRPDTVDCTFGLGWLVEPRAIEVNTGTCTYGAFTQPTLAAIVKGAKISLSLYHFDLVAAEPATAHLAVLVGPHVLMEREIAIPGKANVYAIELVADFDLPEGSPVTFHLHNHGQNTWALDRLAVEVPVQ